MRLLNHDRARTAEVPPAGCLNYAALLLPVVLLHLLDLAVLVLVLEEFERWRVDLVRRSLHHVHSSLPTPLTHSNWSAGLLLFCASVSACRLVLVDVNLFNSEVLPLNHGRRHRSGILFRLFLG